MYEEMRERSAKSRTVQAAGVEVNLLLINATPPGYMLEQHI